MTTSAMRAFAQFANGVDGDADAVEDASTPFAHSAKGPRASAVDRRIKELRAGRAAPSAASAPASIADAMVRGSESEGATRFGRLIRRGRATDTEHSPAIRDNAVDLDPSDTESDDEAESVDRALLLRHEESDDHEAPILRTTPIATEHAPAATAGATREDCDRDAVIPTIGISLAALTASPMAAQRCVSSERDTDALNPSSIASTATIAPAPHAPLAPAATQCGNDDTSRSAAGDAAAPGLDLTDNIEAGKASMVQCLSDEAIAALVAEAVEFALRRAHQTAVGGVDRPVRHP